jgi:uncharacterized protein YyaL (SSP411 family)
MQNTDLKPNKLIKEKSPYLLQHAYNPVNWFPWGDEAFEKAQKENKPIFLSIGYSTCHWCHVMEHESFEDEEVAKLLNESFISIKVDREERSDIDHIYMTVCQIMTGSGGWPLTVIMKPDKKPFFAGTYFPKESKYGRIGMMDLLPQIDNVWKNRLDDVEETSKEIYKTLNEISHSTSGEDLTKDVLSNAFNQLNFTFDSEKGGFGKAPKFPTPHKFLFLLRYFKNTGDKRALEIVEKSLQEMRAGGIYDHIGFGFHRYSTDENWLLPHFEKMLYDQTLLIMAYSEAYSATKNEDYAKTAHEIITYILRDMTHKDGGFYSAEDADSEGEEGKFYVWTEKEIKEVLKENADIFIKTFNISKDGNYIEEATRHKTDTNIPHKNTSSESKDSLNLILEDCRQKLFNVREERIHPYKDDKILTDWNGLMIAALSIAYQSLGSKNEEYLEAAEKSIDFIYKNLMKDDNLLHRYRDGESIINAHLDDYAFLIWGLIEFYQASFKTKYLKDSISLCEKVILEFYDKENDGFFFSSSKNKDLIARMKEGYDGAIPSGNSVMVNNLIKLSRITGEEKYEELAYKTIKAFSKSIKQSPISHAQMMVALEYLFEKSYEIVIVGDSKSEETKNAIREIRKTYCPNKVLLLKSNEDSENVTQIAKFTENLTQLNNMTTVYICEDYNCKIPITDLNKINEALQTSNEIA